MADRPERQNWTDDDVLIQFPTPRTLRDRVRERAAESGQTVPKWLNVQLEAASRADLTGIIGRLFHYADHRHECPAWHEPFEPGVLTSRQEREHEERADPLCECGFTKVRKACEVIEDAD